MCGNCLLQETAFICPLRCPKGLRNGPCGSGSLEHCCVDPDRPCAWCLIYWRAEQMGRLDRLLEVQAPLDWNQVGHDTWHQAIRLAWQRGSFDPRYLSDREAWLQQVEQLFHDLRQPDWWQGDDAYHPPHSDQPVSRLQAALQRGEFVVTAEIAPPLSASGESVQRTADSLRPFITARSVRAAHYLAKGDTVPAIEVDPDTGWLQVRLPGGQQTGWISGKPAYVSIK